MKEVPGMMCGRSEVKGEFVVPKRAFLRASLLWNNFLRRFFVFFQSMF